MKTKPVFGGTHQRREVNCYEKGPVDRRESWQCVHAQILREVRCWPEVTRIRAGCRRNRPVVKFCSTVLPSQDFTVHPEESRNILPPGVWGGIQIMDTRTRPTARPGSVRRERLRLGRDHFDEYAHSVSEIARSCLALRKGCRGDSVNRYSRDSRCGCRRSRCLNRTG